jgi:hypothetical protein
MPTPRKILLIVEDQFLLAMGLRDALEDGGYAKHAQGSAAPDKLRWR